MNGAVRILLQITLIAFAVGALVVVGISSVVAVGTIAILRRLSA